MGSHGHRVDFDAAHSQAIGFNNLARVGTVGTVFHACCLLETTTNDLYIRTLPNVPAGAVWSGLDITRLVPARGVRADSCRVPFTPSIGRPWRSEERRVGKEGRSRW